MTDLVSWLEVHGALAGWAQFVGAMLALLVTYFTAFAPIWRRKRQLHNAASRLLANGYEALESYHRTSAYFDPFPLSVRQASLTMESVAEELSRFPIYELDNQGSNSLARRLVAMGLMVTSVKLFLDHVAADLDGRPGTKDDQEIIREFVEDRLTAAHALLTGEKLKRPEWPG